MALSDFLGVIRRRWYVLIVGLLAAAGLVYAAAGAAQPAYQARGLVLLLPPDDAVGDGGNPFLGLGGLELPAGIVVAYFQSDVAQEAVAQVAPEAEYTVAIEDSTRGPVIAVDVTAPTADGALATLRHVTEDIPVQLERLQGEVEAPPSSMLTSMPLAVDDEAKEDTKGRTRLVMAAAAIGVVGAALLTYVIDGIAMRRRRTPEDDEAVGDDRAFTVTALPPAHAPQDPTPTGPHPLGSDAWSSRRMAERRADEERSPAPRQHRSH